MSGSSVVSVSQLNQYVKSVLEGDRVLNGIMVKGEISNFLCHYKSGHMYFTLKDSGAAIKAVMFRSYAGRVPFAPENGMSVIVSGSVSLYERDGSYQLYVTDMQPDGIGALHLAYEQLKEKLSGEGLFDQAHKRPLPVYPERIGIITSEGAAALQDMLNILSRRYPVARVVLCPAQVQGEGAAQTLIDGLARLNAVQACDVIILGRGGGSIEDLWAFNNEALAHAIFSSKIPVVSAVGHETDYTISDLVADLRAPTPSAAAELVTPNLAELRIYLDDMSFRCANLLEYKLERYALRLALLRERLVTPAAILDGYAQKLGRLQKELERAMARQLSGTQNRIKHLSALLESRSPVRLLERGYSLTTLQGGSISSVGQIKEGDELTTRLADGEIVSSVLYCNKAKDQL